MVLYSSAYGNMSKPSESTGGGELLEQLSDLTSEERLSTVELLQFLLLLNIELEITQKRYGLM
jgi:hypothetical protein